MSMSFDSGSSLGTISSAQRVGSSWQKRSVLGELDHDVKTGKPGHIELVDFNIHFQWRSRQRHPQNKGTIPRLTISWMNVWCPRYMKPRTRCFFGNSHGGGRRFQSDWSDDNNVVPKSTISYVLLRQAQDEIGWDHFIRGKCSQQWTVVQFKYAVRHNLVDQSMNWINWLIKYINYL